MWIKPFLGCLLALSLASYTFAGQANVKPTTPPPAPAVKETVAKAPAVKEGAKPTLTEVILDEAEIGVAERDQTTATNVKALQWPSPLSTPLEADYHQKLLMKFALRNKANKELVNAHQVFVQLVNEETKQEIVFVAVPETATKVSTYKFDLNVQARAKDFGYVNGLYSLRLIVGDAVISNPFVWTVGSIRLTFPAAHDVKAKSTAPWNKVHYGEKPEIVHQYRQPEKRPPTVVSDAFTVLLAVPLVLLLGLWAKIGVNLRGLEISISALVFHVTLAAIFALYALFWLKLNMFTTLKCLLGLGVVAFLSGHSLLKSLAARREKQAKSA